MYAIRSYYVLSGDVGEIARHDDLVRRFAVQVREQRGEHAGLVRMPTAQLPGEPAEETLAEERRQTCARGSP